MAMYCQATRGASESRQGPSDATRPYLIRALYDWCTDNGLTPYVAVLVDDTVHVPREYVKNGEIVQNISFDATSSLKLGNEFIEFKARFAGSAREIMVPVNRVIAIYARENGQGMAFDAPGSTAPAGVPAAGAKAEPTPAVAPAPVALVPVAPTVPGDDPGEPPTPPRPGDRPKLTRVK